MSISMQFLRHIPVYGEVLGWCRRRSGSRDGHCVNRHRGQGDKHRKCHQQAVGEEVHEVLKFAHADGRTDGARREALRLLGPPLIKEAAWRWWEAVGPRETDVPSCCGGEQRKGGKKRQLPELASWRQQKSHDLNIATLLVISLNLSYYCHHFLMDTNMIHASWASVTNRI